MENEDIVGEGLSDFTSEGQDTSSLKEQPDTEEKSGLYPATCFIILSLVLSPFISKAVITFDSTLHFPMLVKILFSAFFLQGMLAFSILTAFFIIPGKISDWKNKLYLQNWQNKFLMVGPLGALLVFIPLTCVSFLSVYLSNYLKKSFGSSWRWLFGPEFRIQQYILNMGWIYFLIFAFAAVAVAPVVEEIAFRNVIFRTFNTKLSTGASIFLTSFLFAVVHMNIESVPAIFLLGVTFQFLFIRYKSVYPSILFHMTFNGISMFLLAVVKYFQLDRCL
jgi:membrane protease YdiL (CAAX protease family)